MGQLSQLQKQSIGKHGAETKMAKEKEQELVPVRTFHVSVAPGDIRTYEKHKDIVPKEHHISAERRGVKLVPKPQVIEDKKKEEEKEKQERGFNDRVYLEKEVKVMSKRQQCDLLLKRGVEKKNIEVKKANRIKQILDSNPEEKSE